MMLIFNSLGGSSYGPVSGITPGGMGIFILTAVLVEVFSLTSIFELSTRILTGSTFSGVTLSRSLPLKSRLDEPSSFLLRTAVPFSVLGVWPMYRSPGIVVSKEPLPLYLPVSASLSSGTHERSPFESENTYALPTLSSLSSSTSKSKG